MKNDGRKFDRKTLETLRLMAVQRVREVERPSAVTASLGFCRTTIYKWLQAIAKPGAGLKTLRAKPATGRPRTLTQRQKWQVFHWRSTGSTVRTRVSTVWTSVFGPVAWSPT